MMKKGLIVCLALLASTALANAQIVYGAGTGGGGGGSGTVTQINTGAGLTGGPITTTGTIAATEVIRAVTGTTDTILSTDAAELITYSNASPVAVTLPQATGSFAAGFAFTIQNLGAGLVTVTPTTSTINGASTLTIAQNRGCDVVSDGTNYQVAACTAIVTSGSGTVNSGTTPNVAYYASSGTAVSDGGAATVTVGAVNIASNLAVANGFALTAANTVTLNTNSAGRVSINTTAITPNLSIVMSNAGAGQMSSLATSSTVPVFIPNKASTTTGFGAQASGVISGIVSGVEKERFTSEGIVSIQATPPAVTGTGTPTIATGSTDEVGEVTAGATATSVIITFNLTHTNAPFCVVTSQTQLVAFAYTLSNTAITITQTATSGNKIDYRCSYH